MLKHWYDNSTLLLHSTSQFTQCLPVSLWPSWQGGSNYTHWKVRDAGSQRCHSVPMAPGPVGSWAWPLSCCTVVTVSEVPRTLLTPPWRRHWVLPVDAAQLLVVLLRNRMTSSTSQVPYCGSVTHGFWMLGPSFPTCSLVTKYFLVRVEVFCECVTVAYFVRGGAMSWWALGTFTLEVSLLKVVS